MKKFINLKIIGTLMVTSFLYGCEDNSNEIITEQKEPQQISYIEQLEHETGVSLYKRDLTIRDEGGDNWVIYRIAAKSQNMVDMYLISLKYKLLLYIMVK